MAFRWDRRWYRVLATDEEWVYREPWWERSLLPDGHPGHAPERTFYRVVVADGGWVELVHREPEGDWRLYRVYD